MSIQGVFYYVVDQFADHRSIPRKRERFDRIFLIRDDRGNIDLESSLNLTSSQALPKEPVALSPDENRLLRLLLCTRAAGRDSRASPRPLSGESLLSSNSF